MNMSKTSKGALVISGVALLICFAMLLGTTWAWFTDEVTSAQNLIQSGELKIDLIHVTDAGEVSIKDKNEKNEDYKVFDYDLWEPGYTQMETLKIVNEGNLALKYRLSVLAYDVPAGDAKLADVIEVYLFPGEVDEDQTTWAEVKKTGKYVGTLSEMIADVDGAAYGILLPKAGTGATDVELDPELEALLPISGGTDDELVATLALHMQETAGNEYQNLSCGNLYLSLVATQLTWENDSFDNDYDTDALYAVTETLANVEGGAYEGDIVDVPLSNALYLNKTYSTADIGLEVEQLYDSIIIENSIFDNKTSIVVDTQDASIIITNTDFIVPEDGKIISVKSGLTVAMFDYDTVTINGQPITQELVDSYVEGNCTAIVTSF